MNQLLKYQERRWHVCDHFLGLYIVAGRFHKAGSQDHLLENMMVDLLYL